MVYDRSVKARLLTDGSMYFFMEILCICFTTIIPIRTIKRTSSYPSSILLHLLQFLSRCVGENSTSADKKSSCQGIWLLRESIRLKAKSRAYGGLSIVLHISILYVAHKVVTYSVTCR